MKKLEHAGHWELMTAEEIEHFKDWKQLYGPNAVQKLFKITTERYADSEGVFCFKTVVDLFIRGRSNETVSDVPEGS